MYVVLSLNVIVFILCVSQYDWNLSMLSTTSDSNKSICSSKSNADNYTQVYRKKLNYVCNNVLLWYLQFFAAIGWTLHSVPFPQKCG